MTPTLTVTQSDWSLTGTTTASASWNAGDLIVVLGVCENNDSGVSGHDDVITTPTATGLTFYALDLDVVTPGGNHCWVGSWQAIATSSGSGNITTLTLNHAHGIMVVVAAAGTHDGVGAHIFRNDTTETASITLQGANSAVAEVIGDWSVGSTTGHTYTPSGATDQQAIAISPRYTIYGATWTNQSAGTTSYGVSVTPPTTPNYNKIIVEIKGVSGPVNVPWVSA